MDERKAQIVQKLFNNAHRFLTEEEVMTEIHENGLSLFDTNDVVQALIDKGVYISEHIQNAMLSAKKPIVDDTRNTKLTLNSIKITSTKEWADDEAQLLTELWNSGATTSEIANTLGVTRNAVIGKAHRLKLPPRESPIKYSSKTRDNNIYDVDLYKKS